MFIVQEVGDELQRRGVDPYALKRAWGSNPNLPDCNTINRRIKNSGMTRNADPRLVDMGIHSPRVRASTA